VRRTVLVMLARRAWSFVGQPVRSLRVAASRQRQQQPPGTKPVGRKPFTNDDLLSELRRPGTVIRQAVQGKAQQQEALPLMNDEIRRLSEEVRVIVDRGEQPDESLGVISVDEALQRANEMGVDLVVIAEKSAPPVCKIVNYGKLKYAKDKKKKEQLKKQSRSNEIKEVKMSYKIGQADYEVRRKNAVKFIQAGNRVKLSIQFRGREQQHVHLGDELIAKFLDDLAANGASVAKTKTTREGRDLTTILSGK